jgi:hypothetical protein
MNEYLLVGVETPVSDLMSDSSFGCAPAAKKRNVLGKHAVSPAGRNFGRITQKKRNKT